MFAISADGPHVYMKVERMIRNDAFRPASIFEVLADARISLDFESPLRRDTIPSADGCAGNFCSILQSTCATTGPIPRGPRSTT